MNPFKCKLGDANGQTKKKQTNEMSLTRGASLARICEGEDVHKPNLQGSSMPLGITKDCFPPASKCHNCERKRREDFVQKTETRDTFKRCGGCHLMTYCDQDCQREHWQKIHKDHCGLLSGQKQVQYTDHDDNTCNRRYYERPSEAEINSIASPKTMCHIEHMIRVMKLILNIHFDFHAEGKTCKCSNEFACNLPFPLGELSGQFIGMGFDDVVSHALKIIYAVLIKKNRIIRLEVEPVRTQSGELAWAIPDGVNGDTTKLIYLLQKVMEAKARHWQNFLVVGVPRQICKGTVKDFLSEPVNNLKVDFGPGSGNMWWKALKFSAEMIESMNTVLGSKFVNSKGMEDPNYTNLKLIHDYNHSQLGNHAVASEKNLWYKFRLWPMWNGNSLVIVLPEGTRCQGCKKDLAGGFNVENEDVLQKNKVLKNSDPILIPRVGEDGELVVFCSSGTSPRCFKDFSDNDAKVHIYKYASSQCVEEHKTFLTKSRFCDMCFMLSLSSHRCTKCWAVQYCSEKCQLKDFQSFHKNVCSSWAKDEFRKIMDGKQQKKRMKTTVKRYFK